MKSSQFLDTSSPQMQVQQLETYIAAGDIPGMARMVDALRKKWDSLEAPMQQDILKLEAIFLSLVHVKAGAG